MSKTPITLLAKRDFGQKINATFGFISQNFKPLVKALLYIAGPPALLAGAANGLVQSRLLNTALVQTSPNPLDFTKYFSGDYFASILFGIVTTLLATSATYSFITLYEKEGSSQSITPNRVWQEITANLSSVVVASIVAILLTVIASLLVFFPGVYVAISISLFIVVIFREKLEPIAALRRSHYLIGGKWWSTFGLLFVMGLIAGIISMVFQLPNLILTFLSALNLGSGAETNKVFFVISGMLSILGSTLVQSLIAIALGFQYYNLVELKEGAGLRSEIDTIGNNSPLDSDQETRF